MTDIYTAQLSSQLGGRWRVFVVLCGVASWPEYEFPPGPVVPTPPERARALNALGYALIDRAEWRWFEYSAIPEDSSSAVVLTATARVEEVVA